MRTGALELECAVELFLSRLAGTLEDDATSAATPGDAAQIDARRIEATARSVWTHGQSLHQFGPSLEQVVRHYGDICRAVTELALERHAAITTAEYQALDRCLDNAIAGALTSWTAEDDERAQRNSEGTSGARRAKRSVVYLVDRDPHVRRLVQKFVADSYVVELFDDGCAALEGVRKASPSALVTEVMIPQLDGLALCRALKSDPLTDRVPVLIASTLAVEERARHSGANAFLGKPLEKKTFLARLRSLIAAAPESGGDVPPALVTS
jgi:CheY-like chemotaxis protein